MSRFLAILFFVVGVLAVHARSLDEQLYDATRYGNTPERREAKRIARIELKASMPEALDAAMRYIHGDHVGLQVLVMEWIQELPAETVVPTLLDYINDERADTRRVAIFFLGFKDVPEHAEKIFSHLDDEETRGAALRTLGKWKIPEARIHAEKWLVEGKERMRVVAANALRDLGDPAALPALFAALDDPVFTVRHTAARAIVSFGETAGVYLDQEDGQHRSPAQLLRQRIRADLRRIPVETALENDGIHLDGAFF
jgi:hypothetical protein